MTAFPAYMPAGATGNSVRENSGDFSQFGHLTFDIDLTFGFWILTFSAIITEFRARCERKFSYNLPRDSKEERKWIIPRFYCMQWTV